MRGHAADLRDQHREARIALEEVLDGDVQRARVRVLLADRLGDHRGVRRQRAGVVRHQQRAAGGGHVLDPLDLGAEPVAVEELDERGVEDALDALRAAPVVQPPLGLDAGQVRLERLGRHQRAAARLAPALRAARAVSWSVPASAFGRSDWRLTIPLDALQGRGARRTSGARWTATGCRASPAPRAASRTSRAPRARPSGSRGTRRGPARETLKANPDSPQTHARRLALEQGKVLVMAVPRLRDQHPFRLLDPRQLDRRAAARGGHHQGRPAPRQGDRPRPGARARPGADRLGGREPEGRARGQGRRLLGPRVRAAVRERQDRPPHGDRHHRPPDPDPAREPADDRARHPGRPGGHAARGDRGGRRPRAPAGDPLGPPPATRRSTRSRCWSASATSAEAVARAPGRSWARKPAQSRAAITPSRSTTSSFQGCRIVAGTMPASPARTMFTGLSSTSTSMPSSTQRVTLSNEQCRSSKGMPIASSQRAVAAAVCDAAVARHVDPVALRRASRAPSRPRPRRARRRRCSRRSASPRRSGPPRRAPAR